MTTTKRLYSRDKRIILYLITDTRPQMNFQLSKPHTRTFPGKLRIKTKKKEKWARIIHIHNKKENSRRKQHLSRRLFLFISTKRPRRAREQVPTCMWWMHPHVRDENTCSSRLVLPALIYTYTRFTSVRDPWVWQRVYRSPFGYVAPLCAKSQQEDQFSIARASLSLKRERASSLLVIGNANNVP